MIGAICINGILSDGKWNTAAANWLNSLGWNAKAYVYWCGVGRLCPRWGWPPFSTNDTRALEVFQMVQDMWIDGCEKIVLLVHSNGAIIAEKVLYFLQNTNIKVELHIFGGDVSPDFEHTGINQAIRDGNVTGVYVYCSWGDYTLASDASMWDTGALGRVGPVNVAEDVKERVHTIRNDSYGHCDWVNGPSGLCKEITDNVLQPSPPGAV